MHKTIACAGIACAALLSHHASAQSLMWEAPLFAQTPPYQITGFDQGKTTTLVDSPFIPSFPNSRSTMLLSDAGEQGIVLAGRAQIDEIPIPVTPPSTPWLAKISRTIGAPLWTWHSSDYVQGYFTEAAVDPTGDVVAVGLISILGEDMVRPLLIKLDGATGTQRWRVDGPNYFAGLALALDANQDIVITASHQYNQNAPQLVAKYSSDTGGLIWSSEIPDAADLYDGLIAIGGDNDVVASDGYEIRDGSQILESGVQIAKFSGLDGRVLWHRRFPSTFFAGPRALKIMPGGDVVLTGKLSDGIEIVRLDRSTGNIVWRRGDIGIDVYDTLIDPDGHIVVAGYAFEPDTLIPIGDVQRIDSESGATLWRRQFPSRLSVAYQLQIGFDGQLLVALSDGGVSATFEAVGMDFRTAALRWLYAHSVPYFDADKVPIGIEQGADGTVYFGGFNYDPDLDISTWTTLKLAPIAADTIFLSGVD